MGELFKAFERFIARDLILIVSGSLVIGSFLYCFGRLPRREDSWVLYFLLGGMAYFIALAIQDCFALLGLVALVAVRDLPFRCLGQQPFLWLYKRYHRFNRNAPEYPIWEPITIDLDIVRDELAELPNKEALDRLERIVTLRQVGTAGGPCAIVAGLLLLARLGTLGYGHQHLWDQALPVVCLSGGVLLIVVSWVRGGQQAQFLSRWGERMNVPNRVLRQHRGRSPRYPPQAPSPPPPRCGFE
jgi:hypothetical protein